MTDTVTAAMLVIGNEILSGRTKDKNIGYLAERLTEAGIQLAEVRIVRDIEADVVEAVRALSDRYNYVITSGGIGPTHDDITADCIALAFDRPIGINPEAYRRLEVHYEQSELPFNEARQRMARTPEGASLIDNPISAAPGFIVGNVHVMAGVPRIFQAMVDFVLPGLAKGQHVLSRAVHCDLGEGTVAGNLRDIQEKHPDVDIGSYPGFTKEGHDCVLVVRGVDDAVPKTVATEIFDMVAALGGNPEYRDRKD
ncbi:MAG: competence/damage-inducible protein A [Alphaproteobacteria bacterium]